MMSHTYSITLISQAKVPIPQCVHAATITLPSMAITVTSIPGGAKYYQNFSMQPVSFGVPCCKSKEFTLQSKDISQKREPDHEVPYTTILLLRWCTNNKILPRGKLVHSQILDHPEWWQKIQLRNLLLKLYVESGSLEHAHVVFNQMVEKDIYAWNVMIRAYVLLGLDRDALHLFDNMIMEDVKPDRFTFSTIVAVFNGAASLESGREMHRCIMAFGLESNIIVATALVEMYGKCGSLKDAQKLFNEMQERDIVSWNAMLAAYVQNGHNVDAVNVFIQMQEEGLKTSKVTFVSVINACGGLSNLEEGKRMHAYVIKEGYELYIIVGNALLNMYAKCKYLDNVYIIFQNMVKRNVISWNIMVTACTDNLVKMDAMQVFKAMQLEDVEPDNVSFVCMLHAYACLADLLECRWIHACRLCSGIVPDIIVETAIVNMYGKCGSALDAKVVFDRMPKKNVVTWNVMIAAYAQTKEEEKAIKLFQEMQAKGMLPNNITFTTMFDACACFRDLEEGKRLHAFLLSCSLIMDVAIGTALVDMYGKCCYLKEALGVFNGMSDRNVTSWTTIIAAFSFNRCVKEALWILEHMQLEGVMPNHLTFLAILDACAVMADVNVSKWAHALFIGSKSELDVVIISALVNMYGKCGTTKDAWFTFNTRVQHNVVSWTSMVVACAENGHDRYALEVFQQMQLEGIVPHAITLISALEACASLAALTEGKWIHAQMLHSGLDLNPAVTSAVINMYAKCGNVKDAQKAFIHSFTCSIVCWNVMIGAYCQNADTEEALQLFWHLLRQGMMPDAVTYLNFLAACTFKELVDESCNYFLSISHDCGMLPTIGHCGCLLSLLGRIGWLDETEDFIINLLLDPTFAIWTTLLGGCRLYHDVERARRATTHVVGLLF